jgi:hypothetical protein
MKEGVPAIRASVEPRLAQALAERVPLVDSRGLGAMDALVVGELIPRGRARIREPVARRRFVQHSQATAVSSFGVSSAARPAPESPTKTRARAVRVRSPVQGMGQNGPASARQSDSSNREKRAAFVSKRLIWPHVTFVVQPSSCGRRRSAAR